MKKKNVKIEKKCSNANHLMRNKDEQKNNRDHFENKKFKPRGRRIESPNNTCC